MFQFVWLPTLSTMYKILCLNNKTVSFIKHDLPASPSLQPELPFQPGVNEPDMVNDLNNLYFSTGRKTTPCMVIPIPILFMCLSKNIIHNRNSRCWWEMKKRKKNTLKFTVTYYCVIFLQPPRRLCSLLYIRNQRWKKNLSTLVSSTTKCHCFLICMFMDGLRENVKSEANKQLP